jgi:hypothetical protein
MKNIWSNFTRDNILLFKSNKYLLNNNNILVEKLKNERIHIKTFIKNFNTNINIEIITDIILLSKLNKKIIKYSNQFFVHNKGVIDELNNNISINVLYRITWGISNTIIIKTNEEQFKKFKPRIKFIIRIIEYFKFKTNNNINNMTIYLILTGLTKFFPNNKIIDVKHVNSGYTDFNENIIFIWRYEEFEKVLFHELIHYFDLDSRDHNFHNIINFKGHHACYYEAITDFWGISYYLIFISLVSNISLKILLEIELIFIRNQAMQLNNYYKLKNWKTKPNKIIEQKTSAFSYYIIKYLLFEYALNNNIDINMENYNDILKEILDKGFKTYPYIKINSARMTLLQLK